ncbi:MAG: ChaN family lipoprotein [Betaproteobacteria bacterium]
MRRALAALAAGALLLAGCATNPPAALEGRIWDARGGHYIDEDTLLARLRAARYRLLGEVHDHPEHHAIRARLLEQLAPTEVFFEQFDREHDPALRAAQRAGADADALARAGRLDEKGWRWPLHRPLLEASLRAGHAVRAANLPRAEARRVVMTGKVEGIALPEWPAAAEAAMRREIEISHCGALPAKVVPAMVLAQRARDATIAAALSGAAGGAVLIAGNGHVRRDRGVSRYLPEDASVVSLGFIETRAGEADPRAYDPGAYDYLWFTLPQPRPDPCEGMRKGS